MAGATGLFEFLIDVEKINMRNPFRTRVIKESIRPVIETITKHEFEAVLQAEGTADSIIKLGGKGEKIICIDRF